VPLIFTSNFANAALAARTATPAQLALLLQEVRNITLALFDDFDAANMLQPPYSGALNPPLWELGHVGWFQEYWIARNQQCDRGVACQPVGDNARAASILRNADDWYDSSAVDHASRWHLPLLQALECKAYLAETLRQTLVHLQRLAAAHGHDDATLYFYRLVIFHEAMHAEAAIYMAQALGVPIKRLIGTASNLAPADAVLSEAVSQIQVPVQRFQLGSMDAQGFCFDNELPAHEVALGAFVIDAQVVSWAQYLRFVEATNRALPRYIRRVGIAGKVSQSYEASVFGRWQPVAMQAAAVHLTWQDAVDWCAWAGRRLPSEAEWECAALQNANFNWGQVWEWTASKFLPYDGFVAHPYLDYSAPWFGSRMVLRGACTATLPRMRHPKYRNYFTPDRNDIYAGFRSCAL
jgi:gamma-glutamyl hercynylcysteine S-oxide synthase